MKYIILLLAVFCITGCSTTTKKEFYFPDENTLTIDSDGAITEIHGALKSIESETKFTLGTEGVGTYNFFPLSMF